MAFPTSQSRPETLAQALAQIKDEAGRVKVFAQQIKARSLAGAVPAHDVTSYVGGLAAAKDEIGRLAATPGLGDYAQTEYQGIDIGAEYATMLAQINATIAWVVANFPKTPATGELRERTLGADGRPVAVTFSTSALAGFRTQLDALIATLD
jgi:hypothetical protein